MKAQAAHAESVPVAQRLRLDARVGDGDAAQPLRIALQRIEQHAIVVAVRVALHREAMREAEVVEQRNEALDRRVGRRIAASGAYGNLSAGPKICAVAVPGAGRRQQARPFRLRHRAGDARRLRGAVGHAITFRMDVRTSAQMNVGVLHHAAPQLHLAFDEDAEFFRRVRPRLTMLSSSNRALTLRRDAAPG